MWRGAEGTTVWGWHEQGQRTLRVLHAVFLLRAWMMCMPPPPPACPLRIFALLHVVQVYLNLWKLAYPWYKRSLPEQNKKKGSILHQMSLKSTISKNAFYVPFLNTTLPHLCFLYSMVLPGSVVYNRLMFLSHSILHAQISEHLHHVIHKLFSRGTFNHSA